jgi:HD-GYP domain-containing protein (c-di-GMP phosphodiesterase class II)
MNAEKRRYPLQIAISTLFIAIAVSLGLILSWQSFNKTSDIMLTAADELHEQITHELFLDFKATYGSVAGGIRQLRLSPVIHAHTFAERIAYLPIFAAALESDPALFSAAIAYANGDYFSARRVNKDTAEPADAVPAAAAYIVTYLKPVATEPGFESGKRYTFYYDDELNELAHDQGRASQFDPRLRPWYEQANDKPHATSPYVFYESKLVGLTAMSATAEPGVVVAFDITLDNLSQSIAKYRLTPHSEVVLINAQGQTFAYKDQQKIIINKAVNDEHQLQLANLKQLGSGVLTHLSEEIESKRIAVKEQDLRFEYDGQQWLGSARIVAKPGDVDLYALMLSPVDELLADAVAIRQQLIFIALTVLLIFIPVIWFTAKKISTPLNILSQQAEAIARFEFDETPPQSSFVKEVDQLDAAMAMMKSTINNFIKLINSLAGEQDLDALLKSITRETMLISQSDAALIYLMDETDDRLKAEFLCDTQNKNMRVDNLSALTAEDARTLLHGSDDHNSRVLLLDKSETNVFTPLLDLLQAETLLCIVLPLQNRNNEVIGLLCLINQQADAAGSVKPPSNIEFVEALSGFAAVTLESRQLFKMQEALLHAFIKLIAGAIDAKSPYTGGHCQRVPEITMLLAKAACDSTEEKFSDFDLDEKQWQELNIACWLHDCGKVTTPEYVVDKATKLETIYDRIHEVRTRFEVLKRDAEIECWQKIADGGDKQKLMKKLHEQHTQLDDDFAFVAECNVGGEFMADEKLERLQRIAQKTWMRTLDDNLGLSWEELNRKNSQRGSPVDAVLPAKEKLLADKPEHLIARSESDKIPQDNPWGFKVDTPEYKYNRGELHNLSVPRGTLSEEERYMINGHMIQTIIMLNNLPYPKYLRQVPSIAGSHHETMDGKGYPKRLLMSEQPLTARMMVIADIFEALTASDRPYKKAKTLNESLRIMSFMRNDRHIDAQLFDLFLTGGVYLQYAKKFLAPEQIDAVNIADYLS